MDCYNCSDSCSTSTNDTINALCNQCTYKRGPECGKLGKIHYKPTPSYNPGASTFASLVTPLTNLVPGSAGTTGCVEFYMRRRDKTIKLQWQPFSGNLAASGIAYLTVIQSISNTPPYPITMPIYIIYKGVGRTTHITIDPHTISGNILFYLNPDGSTTDTTIGDNVLIPGGCVTWLVE